MFQWSGLYFSMSFGSFLLPCKECMHISSLSPNCSDYLYPVKLFTSLLILFWNIFPDCFSPSTWNSDSLSQFSRLLVKGHDLHFCVSHCHFYYVFLTIVLINQNLISFAMCRQYRILSNNGLNPIFLLSFSHILNFILWYSYLLA